MKTIVTAAWLWDGSTLIPDPIVEIEDGRISSMGSRLDGDAWPGAQEHHYAGAILAPAFLDIHVHGASGHDVMEATPAALGKVSAYLASRGTGCFLATTVTASLESTLRSLEGLADLIEQAGEDGWTGARPLGIHLEGPFLSHVKRGVHPPAFLLAPDVATFDRLYEAGRGHVRLMTLAPELAGAAELTAHATARGVRVSLGHSNATASETHPVIAAGACSATHTFNAMRPLDHREPGILGTVLANDALYAELICDGIHVDPALVKLWWRAKGATTAILVTDGMSATGMPDGEYQLGGFPVQVANGRATANGVLAGSVLTMDRALANFVGFTGTLVETALPLLTRNPATMTGLTESAGTLRVGGRANLVAVDRSGKLLAAVIAGSLQLRAN